MRLIQGIGTNDADYVVTGYVDGKRKIICPFYRAWSAMLKRCAEGATVRPSYAECSVTPEWHRFSVFKAWMETQDWEDKALDKDLLVEGNKVYSPEMCMFVSKAVNSFATEKKSNVGIYPLGVTYNWRERKFASKVHNSTAGEKRQYLGYFDTAEEASEAYKAAKWEIAKVLASKQTDQRVADAILKRYEYKG